MEHLRFLEMAVDLSEKALDAGAGGPFGAVIVRDGVVLGSSGNRVFENTDPTSHAEIMAIRDACANANRADLSGATIYSSAEPCPMCMAAIYWARISHVFFANTEEDSLRYGFIDKLILQELRKAPEDRSIKSARIENKHAIEIFEKAREQGFGSRPFKNK